MDKKYELIETPYGFYRVKALKDFILITGETVKKGDVGGLVYGEHNLSQEGNCWIMNYACVFGKVFGNAVIKDFAVVYGTVSENAVVKDCGYVRKNATVTGNAVVQAHQYIIYGTVTTDLLGTKDWAGALYAEFGVIPKDGKVTLYKNVWSTDNPNVFKSDYNRKFLYEIGKEVEETDVDENVMNNFGKGLHFTSLHFTSLEYVDEDVYNTIIECEVDLEDIITVQSCMVRARKCRVIRVYKGE